MGTVEVQWKVEGGRVLVLWKERPLAVSDNDLYLSRRERGRFILHRG